MVVRLDPGGSVTGFSGSFSRLSDGDHGIAEAVQLSLVLEGGKHPSTVDPWGLWTGLA